MLSKKLTRSPHLEPTHPPALVAARWLSRCGAKHPHPPAPWGRPGNIRYTIEKKERKVSEAAAVWPGDWACWWGSWGWEADPRPIERGKRCASSRGSSLCVRCMHVRGRVPCSRLASTTSCQVLSREICEAENFHSATSRFSFVCL